VPALRVRFGVPSIVPVKAIGWAAAVVEIVTAPVVRTTAVLNVMPPVAAVIFMPAIVTGPVFTSREANVEGLLWNVIAFAAALAEFRVTRFNPRLSAPAIPSQTIVPAPVTLNVMPEAADILPNSADVRVRVAGVPPRPIPPPERDS
jgi:hypothetical protein